jgi:hypothetical protein
MTVLQGPFQSQWIRCVDRTSNSPVPARPHGSNVFGSSHVMGTLRDAATVPRVVMLRVNNAWNRNKTAIMWALHRRGLCDREWMRVPCLAWFWRAFLWYLMLYPNQFLTPRNYQLWLEIRLHAVYKPSRFLSEENKQSSSDLQQLKPPMSNYACISLRTRTLVA